MECPKCHSENPKDTFYCGKCGTQLPPLKEIPVSPTETLQTPIKELTTGSTFAGRYQVIEELGKGGMGRVYKVFDTDIKEKIALKLLKPEIAADKETIERFRNELRFTRKIRHKNVCQMFDLGKEEGTHFITMEYVAGEDLKSFIKRSGQLTVGKAIFVAKQVCEGLAEAHCLGVIHRDLKPQNIMIDKEGNARIMDFGIARSLRAKGITGAGVMIGTPEYMSPEQVEGKEADQRSDIYSLGIILYEMVTGRVPFEGETPLSIAVKQKTEVPQDPRAINAQVPLDLSRVLLKCMEKEKEKRYQSAEEVLSELNKIEKGFPTTERIIPKRESFTSREITVKFRLKRLFIPALVFIALVLTGIVIWRFLPSKEKETVPGPSGGKPSLAVMYFENLSDQKDLDKILVNMLTTNLSRYEGLEVMSAQRLFDILKQLGKQDAETIDKKTATDVAMRAGVKTMLLGSIIKIGNKIRISPQLIDVKDGSVIATEQVDGNKPEDIFGMVDDLTAKIGTKLGVLSAGGRGEKPKIEDVTTNSFEAYQYYQKGIENMWRFNFPDALKNFEQAVAIDPTFAMAHLYRGLMKANIGANLWDPFADLTSVRKSIQLGKKYASKATDKEQRFIDIYVAFFNRQYKTAERLASDFVKRYPNEKEGAFLLAMASWFIGKYDQCFEAFEKTLEIDPTYANAYNMLAYTYSWKFDHEKAISTIKKYLALQPDVWNPYDSAYDVYMNAGRYDDALQTCEEALKQNPSWASSHLFNLYLGYTHLFKGEMETAHEDIRRAIELRPASKIFYTWQMGCMFLFEGKYSEALNEFQKAVELAQKEKNAESELYSHLELGKMFAELNQYSKALKEFSLAEKISGQVYRSGFNPLPVIADYFAGVATVKKEDYAGARALAVKIEKLIQSQKFDDFYKDFYFLLQGELLVAQGDGRAAKDALEKCSIVSKTFSPRYRVLEAASYALEGATEKAINAYLDFQNTVAICKNGPGEYFYYFLESSRVDYYIARLYEKHGNNIKAIEYYTKSLERWKNADPGIPEIEDAKGKLAALKSQ